MSLTAILAFGLIDGCTLVSAFELHRAGHDLGAVGVVAAFLALACFARADCN